MSKDFYSLDNFSPRSVCPPAHRTVVLHAIGYDDSEDIDCECYPVLCIEVGDYFSETIRRSDHVVVRKSPLSCYQRFLIVDLDGDISTTDDLTRSVNPQSTRSVVCEWPREEDEKRFAPLLVELRKNVAEYREMRRKDAAG